MKKLFLIFFIIFLIIVTTLTKNSTKKIDKQIFYLTEDIRFLKNNYELVVLEHNYLSSPKKLLEYQKRFFEMNCLQLILKISNKWNLKMMKFL